MNEEWTESPVSTLSPRYEQVLVQEVDPPTKLGRERRGSNGPD